MNKKEAFLSLVKLIAPILISVISPKLSPIADNISDAMQEAENLQGARGVDKLNHVQKLGKIAAEAVNEIEGSTVVDTNKMGDLVANAVSTVVDVINKVNAAKK